jgi:uncharacterized protein (TIGR03546 family)
MVIFSLKLLNNLRKAIAGRRFPHQLAGGVALGALLGVIPLGNLLALFVLLAILCFRINHALMGVVAILVSFSATRLDPYSHLVGEYVLTHPSASQVAAQAWSLPLVPWTDLNNTVVMGSFLIGLVATLPIFALTLPLFRMIAPVVSEADGSGEDQKSEAGIPVESRRTNRVDDSLGATDVSAAVGTTDLPVPAGLPSDAPPGGSLVDEESQNSVSNRKRSGSVLLDKQIPVASADFSSRTDPQRHRVEADTATIRIDGTPTAERSSIEQLVSVETRIDVIRMTDFQEDESSSLSTGPQHVGNEPEKPMDEALTYLLHQLRHSQQRKAAG